MPNEAKYDFIDDLDASLPNDSDPLEFEGAQHIRGSKGAVKGSFPNLGQAAVTKTAAELNNVLTKTELAALYPVGSIFIGGDPSSVLGGTWTRLENVMLIGASATYPAGSTGGSKDAVLPSHNHGGLTTAAGSHSHTLRMTIASAGTETLPTGSNLNGANNVSSGTSIAAVGDHQHGINLDGVSPVDANLPPYFAVTMWQRTG